MTGFRETVGYRLAAGAIGRHTDHELVLQVLTAAAERGASHEDFVEAGLAGDYVAQLRRLVEREGLAIRTDFATGQPRWVLVGARAAA